MITIWKYPLEVTDNQIVMMPKNAKILTVQVQRGQPCLWALVDAGQKQGPRMILTVGTGEDAAHVAGRNYVGTYQLFDEDEVYHVFA